MSEVFQVTCVCHDEGHTTLTAQNKCHTVVYTSLWYTLLSSVTIHGILVQSTEYTP